MSEDYQIIKISSLEEFRQYKSEIITFENKDVNFTLFTSFSWIECWLSAYSNNLEIVILLVRNDKNLVALFPLFITRGTSFQIAVKRMEFISLRSHGDLMKFPCLADFESVIRSVLSYLLASEIAFDFLFIESLDEKDNDITILNSVCEKLILPRKQGQIIEDQRDWYIPIQGSFEEYYTSLSSNFKNSLRNKRNHAAKLGGISVLHETSFIENSEIWKGIEKIDQDSWHFQSGIGIFSKKNIRFYSNLAQSFSNNGLDMWLLKIGDVPAAFVFSIIYKNKVYGLRWEYAQSFKECSPGHLLRLEMLKHFFEKQYSEFDLLGKHDQSKQKWTSHFRQQTEFLIYNNTLRGKIVYALKFGLKEKLSLW